MSVTFEDIQKVNQSISTTPIKGKDYAEVNQRIKAFRMLYPNGAIRTEMLSNDGAVCVFRAVVCDNDGNVLGTGTAFEEKDNGFINKTSYVENCETSSVGRALAMCGIGIDVSIASADEVANAINNQDKKPDAVEGADIRAKVMKYIRIHLDEAKTAQICRFYKVEKPSQLTTEQCKHYVAQLEKNGGNIDE